MINKKDKARLFELFENAISKATQLTIQRHQDTIESKKKVQIGNLLVCKNSTNFYDIVDFVTKKIIYENIELYDAAIIIAHQENKNKKFLITEVLKIDKEYSKHTMDMAHYSHCYKIVKKKNNIDRMLVLEDKFQLSEQLSKMVKLKLLKFKSVI